MISRYLKKYVLENWKIFTEKDTYIFLKKVLWKIYVLVDKGIPWVSCNCFFIIFSCAANSGAFEKTQHSCRYQKWK